VVGGKVGWAKVGRKVRQASEVEQVGGKKEVLQRTFSIEFKAQLPRGFSYFSKP
jgi:hypothetical protein